MSLRVFAAPAAIAIASLFGLLIALLGDGWHDVLAWIALASPLVAAVWAWLRRRV
ncbi:MAG TPA: hypothetical protein PJ986_16345 [Gammaproteobacteria bacterium]|nr:hypothetical protein [Gammaproteobacteria bacterium]